MDYVKEIDELQAEGEMPLEELLASLPSELLISDQDEEDGKLVEKESNEESVSLESTQEHTPAGETMETALDDGKFYVMF